jgi:hypothetical protein
MKSLLDEGSGLLLILYAMAILIGVMALHEIF